MQIRIIAIAVLRKVFIIVFVFIVVGVLAGTHQVEHTGSHCTVPSGLTFPGD